MTAQAFDMTHERERHPLPTWEQLSAITVWEDLDAMLPALDATITKIETDLDFRDGDDNWHARARGALTAHQICRKNIERRMRQLRPRKGPPQATPETKLERARLGAQRQEDSRKASEARRERQKIAAQQAVATQRQAARGKIAKAMHATSLGHAFMHAALRDLSPEIYADILAKASKMVENTMQQMLKPEADA